MDHNSFMDIVRLIRLIFYLNYSNTGNVLRDRIASLPSPLRARDLLEDQCM